MKRYLFYTLCVFYLFNLIGVDARCSSEERALLKEKANKVEFSYEHRLVEEDDYLNEGAIVAYYDITAYNMDPDLSIRTEYVNIGVTRERKFTYNKTGQATLTDFSAGRVKITIEGNTKDCKGTYLAMKNFDLLFYNTFYDSESCQQYPDFALCQSSFDKKYVDNVRFNKELNKYIEEKEKEEENKKKEEEEKKKEPINEKISFRDIIIIVGCLVGIVVISFGVIVLRAQIKKRSL